MSSGRYYNQSAAFFFASIDSRTGSLTEYFSRSASSDNEKTASAELLEGEFDFKMCFEDEPQPQLSISTNPFFRRHFSDYSSLSSESSSDEKSVSINLELKVEDDVQNESVVIPLEHTEVNNEESEDEAELERKRLIGIFVAQLFIGLSRDPAWVASAYRGLDIFEGRLGDFIGQTLTQMIECLPVTMVVAPVVFSVMSLPALVKMYRKSIRPYYLNDNKRTWSTMASLAFASWSSIPVWNAAQLAGQKFGEWLGWSAKSAAYLSGCITGPIETIWQNMLILPYLLDTELEPWNIALNALGGAVWVWGYELSLPEFDLNFTQEEQINTSIFAVIVSTEVALTTLCATLLAWKIQDYCNKKVKNETTPLFNNEPARLFHHHQLKVQPAYKNPLASSSKSEEFYDEVIINEDLKERMSPKLKK